MVIHKNKELYKNLNEDSIGNRIKKSRLLLGLDRNKLSKLIGIHYTNLSNLETNIDNITLKNARLLSMALKKPDHYFYDDYLKFITSDFPNKIKTWRTKKGYTQKDLAELLSCKRNAVGKWENGQLISRINFEKLKALGAT